MHTFVDGLDRFLGDHHNEVVLALALLVLTEAVIIWLWARRASALRARLDTADEAAGRAATHAATALAVDALRSDERRVEIQAVRPSAAAAAPASRPAAWAPVAVAPVPDPAAVYAPPPPAAAAPPAPFVPPRPAAPYAAPQPAPPPFPPPVQYAAPQPAPYAPPSPPAEAASVSAAAGLYAAPVASLSPVDTAAALRAAAAAPERATVASAGVAGWAVEAAAQFTPAPIEEQPATGLGALAAWTQAAPMSDGSPPWSWAGGNAPEVSAQPATATKAPVNLLLVEDDVNVAKLYRMLLESRGYTVRHAADGVEGLEAARTERPDLILLDVMMPRMNGISFLQALRDDPTLGAIPAVVLSNFREPRLVERAMALGALEYMVKAQTRPETLVGAIPHWLRGERVVTA
jgi:CheY-like chemotaxis protein